jgi:uncharacterized membrane protein YkvA (DUF1232 family)
MEREPDYAERLNRSIETRLRLLAARFPNESFGALRHLVELYRLIWRLAFDLELPPGLRHYAGALACYVFSVMDFLPDEAAGPMGYVDDLAVAVYGLRTLRPELGVDVIQRHWKADLPLDNALVESEALLTGFLPERVAEKVLRYVQR